MRYSRARTLYVLMAASLCTSSFFSPTAFGQRGGDENARRPDPAKARVIEHWSQERRESATPRDLVLDPRGLGYLRRADGSLLPHGHQISPMATAGNQQPLARPAGGNNDTTPPTIEQLTPQNGATIGASSTFSARVTDDSSGVRSVTIVIHYPDNVTTQSFQATDTGGDVWSVTLQGFTDGSWGWSVEARDNAKKGGNKETSSTWSFTVATGGSGGGGGDGGDSGVVTNEVWSAGGAVQTAAGRIYFEMPNNAKRNGPWSAYVCSGTVVDDNASARSVILTAAHCVYDDVNKAFARNVLFIPDQANTSGTKTDTNCSNDPLGCWVASYGVVDLDWTTRTFPGNVEWDYAFYVVSDEGAHDGGPGGISEVLDSAAGSLTISFATPAVDDQSSDADLTHGLGYSYSDDPNLMYCAEDMTTEGSVNWWLPSCLLSGGSSGGPWVQPMDEGTGNGPIVSVNSWGYTSAPGMAGPMLDGACANSLYTIATSDVEPAGNADGDAGTIFSCPPP